MSTQGKIKTLYSDREQTEAIFPRTTTNAIFDEDGVGLEAILSTTVHAKEEFENNSEVTLNDADTFGGNTPDYFASTEDLQEVNSRIDTLVFPVKSVNLKTGNVTLTAADVGAATEAFVKNEIANAKLDNSGSGVDLSGYATKDDLNNLATKNEVNAIDFPVDSVNGKTGAVTLSASDVGAATSSHTHNYAGSSSAGGAATSANKVNKNLVVKLNSGSTEGTNLFTFNGSTAKTVNVTPSTIGAAASSHNHSASNITSGTLLVARGGTGVTTEALIGLKAYPVGSIYMAYNSTSPASRFGGTWTQIKDRFLLGVGSTYAAAKTGGAATHTLTEAQMPVHKHVAGINLTATGIGSHFYVPPATNNTGKPDYDWKYYTHDAGSGKAHNNMPPYQTVYMWRRTA